MPQASLNTYRISVEPNQVGKYEVRLEARFVERGWTLRVYFLASTPERLLARLQRVLRYLQREEEELWLWGSSPSDRTVLFDELLRRAGLELDRRKEFPRRPVVLTVRSGESFRPLQLAEFKRKLAARLASIPRAVSRRLEAVRSSA